MSIYTPQFASEVQRLIPSALRWLDVYPLCTDLLQAKLEKELERPISRAALRQVVNHLKRTGLIYSVRRRSRGMRQAKHQRQWTLQSWERVLKHATIRRHTGNDHLFIDAYHKR